MAAALQLIAEHLPREDAREEDDMGCGCTCEIIDWELVDIEEPRRITSDERCDLPHPPFFVLESHIKVLQTPPREVHGCANGCVCRPVGEREEVLRERVYRGIDMIRWDAEYTKRCTSTYWYTATLVKYRTKGECVSGQFEFVQTETRR
jgi:hypothetical protein